MKKTLFYFFLFSSILLITCQKEVSYETGGAPSHGSLLDDGSGDCLPKTVNGTYIEDTALKNTNTIQVAVNVTKTGKYTIVSDTVNGYYFKATGIFSTVGSNSVTLKGYGTPAAPGVNNFLIQYDSSACNVAVTVLPAGSSVAVGTLDGAPNACTPVTVNGTYTQGTALVSGTNTVQIRIDVATAGSYNITATSSSNPGFSFSGTGTVAVGNDQLITLDGSGNPTASGTITFAVTFGSSTCTFTVNVGGTSSAVGTLDGAPNACTPATVNGTYTQGTALVSGNTVQIRIDVTTGGSYNITATSSSNPGFSFSGSGTVAIGNDQLITLNGTGTPTASGTITFTVTFGTSTCTFTVNVTASGSNAVGTLDGAPNACAPITVNGTYTQNTALVSTTHTVQVRIDVTTAGNYNITATSTPNPGFSFSGSGTVAVGNDQLITLNGTGTPTTSGTITFTVTFGTSTCTFTVNVAAPPDYFPRTTNSNWSYEWNDVATDSILRYVISATLTVPSGTYNIFMQNDGTGPDSSGYYRKNGGDYFEYFDAGGFIGYDNPLWDQYIMLKDNVVANTTWYSNGFSGTIGGNPYNIRFKYTVLQKDVPITITASTGGTTYQNVIVVEEKYQQEVSPGNWQDITSLVGYGKSYYARNIGLIQYEYFDPTGTRTDWMELRRYVVY